MQEIEIKNSEDVIPSSTFLYVNLGTKLTEPITLTSEETNFILKILPPDNSDVRTASVVSFLEAKRMVPEIAI